MDYSIHPTAMVYFNQNDQSQKKSQIKKNNYKMDSTYLSIDKAIEFVGDNSRFQKRVIIIFSIQWMLFSFLIMGMPLLFQTPIFLCQYHEGQEPYQCIEAEACSPHNLSVKKVDNKDSFKSLTLTYELYCDKSYIIGLCGTIFFLGSACAGFIFPQLSENKGRKFAILFSIGLGGISILFSGIISNLYVFIISLFFAGLGLNGFETLSLVYASEISAEKFRNYASVILTSTWAVAQIIYSMVTYFSTSWRFNCIFVIGIPFLLTIYFSKMILVETPRYLVAKGRYQEAKIVLQKISLINRRPKFDYKIEGEDTDYIYNFNYNAESVTPFIDTTMPEKQQRNYTYIDLFRYNSLRYITFSMIIMWLFRYLTYFGFQFSIANLGGEIHQNLIWVAIPEIVACIMTAPIKLMLKRRATIISFALISSISCIAMLFLQIPSTCYEQGRSCLQKYLTVLLGMVIKFNITLYNGILLTYTSELFPTVVRTLGYGLCMTSGKAGTVFMPMIVTFFNLKEINPLVMFGSFGLIVIYVAYKLPETKDRVLQDQIDENNITEVPLVDIGYKRISRKSDI